MSMTDKERETLGSYIHKYGIVVLLKELSSILKERAGISSVAGTKLAIIYGQHAYTLKQAMKRTRFDASNGR